MTGGPVGIAAATPISIHIPRVGDDMIDMETSGGSTIFQSTSPVWGMTVLDILTIASDLDFNPHPPCGG